MGNLGRNGNIVLKNWKRRTRRCRKMKWDFDMEKIDGGGWGRVCGGDGC